MGWGATSPRRIVVLAARDGYGRRLPTSDADLLQAWSNGDADAGERLFERHYAKVSRFFFNKSRDGDAADLIQRTFLRCVERYPAKRPETPFVVYLLGIARNVLFKYYRGRGPQPLDFRIHTLVALVPTPTSVIEQQQEASLLLHALRRIPIEMQVALELFLFEGMADRDIAGTLDVPLGTVRTWIRRGKQRLREQVDKLALDPSMREGTLGELERWSEVIRAQTDKR